MRKILSFMMVLFIISIPLTVNGDVFPSTWTGYVYVEGDGAGGVIDTVPSGLSAIEGLELSLGAVLDQANDLTIEATAASSVKVGILGDTTLNTYNITAGTLTVNGTDVLVGYGAGVLGTINQTGGTVDTNKNTVIGWGDGSVGTYAISGASTLCEAGWTILGETIGSSGTLTIEDGATYKAQVNDGWESGAVTAGMDGGTGALTVATGGTLEARDLYIGRTGLWNEDNGGVGTATLSDGTINITHGNIYLGNKGTSTGLFTQTGGTVDIVTYSDGTWQKDLVLGFGGTGTYDMQGGSYLGDWSILGESGGTGTLNISGDASFVTTDLTIGLGTGTGALNLSGGTLDTGTITLGNAGTFTFTGGTLSADAVSGILVDQQGGVVSPGDSPGTSAFDTGYTMQAGSYLVEINGTDQGDATDSDGIGYDWIDVTGAASLDGTVEVNLIDDFAPTAGNAFDILTATESITLGTTFSINLDSAELTEGLTWSYSVVDLVDAGQALRLVAASINPRIAGDANNDGKVDGSDVTILANNWQAGVPDGDPENVTWNMGDFNGDGKVDGSDVTILANNWQYGVTTAASAVPEPSTIILLLGLVTGMLVLRRR